MTNGAPSPEEFPKPSSTPIFVVLGVTAASVILFFTVTLPMFRKKSEHPNGPAPAPQVAETPGATPDSPAATTQAQPRMDPDAPSATPAESSGQAHQAAPGEAPAFRNEAQLLHALADQIGNRNFDAAVAIIGEGTLPDLTARNLEAFIERGNFNIDPAKPLVEIGQIDNRIRYALNLSRPASASLPAEEKTVLVDLAKDPKKGWQIAGIQLPAFTALAAPLPDATPDAAPGATPAGAPQPPATEDGKASPPSLSAPGAPAMSVVIQASSDSSNDPLTVAHQFVSALVKKDFSAARTMLDAEKVTEEKLAGLFIVSEEADFRLRDSRPLIATAATEESAWVIAQLASDSVRSDFGIELQRTPDGWKIVGINFSKLIADRAAASGADTVTYTPLVENPQGGDSLVLYFEYDDEQLHDRAARQVSIISEILKSDPVKKIFINGHADSMGPDGYNEDLSKSRARAVRDGLLANGVHPSQIVVRAFGESKPASPNVYPNGSDNPDGRKRNRRAEVYLEF